MFPYRSIRQQPAQRGAISVAFMMALLPLLAFAGIAVDGSRLFIAKTRAQNAADACALAAAPALTGGHSSQLSLAESWGQRLATRNLGTTGDARIGASIVGVTFATSSTGTFRTRQAIPSSEANTMRAVRCDITVAGASPWLTGLWTVATGESVRPQGVRATATAAMTAAGASCAMPLAICRAGNTNLHGYKVGDRLKTGFNGYDGDYGHDDDDDDDDDEYHHDLRWVSYDNSAKGSQLPELVRGAGQCQVKRGDTVRLQKSLSSSTVTSLRHAFNGRFGLYPSGSTPDDDNAVPDFSGASLLGCKAGSAFSELAAARAAFTPAASISGYARPSSKTHLNEGGDRRVMTVPVIDCDASSTPPILDLACVVALDPATSNSDSISFELLGLASNPASGCASAGLPGGPGSTGALVPTLVQ